jgi:hypothetical protein
MAILEVECDPARWHVLEAEFDSNGRANTRLTAYSRSGTALPLARWTILYPDIGAVLQSVPTGLALRTGTKPRTDAAGYGPIVVPASGRYGFVLRCTPRAGKFVFGVLAEDGVTWLSADVVDHAGSSRKLECWLDLQKGQTILLRIANTSETEASLVINEVTAFEIDSESAARG